MFKLVEISKEDKFNTSLSSPSEYRPNSKFSCGTEPFGTPSIVLSVPVIFDRIQWDKRQHV
jgi:hypothetical protein